MDGQHAFPLYEWKLIDRVHDLNARIRDQNIDAPEF